MKSRTHLPLSIVFKSTFIQTKSIHGPDISALVNLLEDPWLPLTGAEFAPARDSHKLSIVVLLLVRETDGAHVLTEPHRGGELYDGQVPVHAAEAEVIVMKSSKRGDDKYTWPIGNILSGSYFGVILCSPSLLVIS